MIVLKRKPSWLTDFQPKDAHYWTDQQIEHIRLLRKAAWTWAEIARLFGAESGHTVKRAYIRRTSGERFGRSKGPYRVWTRKDQKALIAMREAKPPLSYKQCAELLGRDVYSVYQKAFHLGLTKKIKTGPRMVSMADELLSKGLSLEDAAAEIGVSKYVLAEAMEKAGRAQFRLQETDEGSQNGASPDDGDYEQ